MDNPWECNPLDDTKDVPYPDKPLLIDVIAVIVPGAWTGDDEDNLPLPGKPLLVVPVERSRDNEFELPLLRIMCSVPEDE
ncbi:hypothetical protein OEA41_000938 [Lepraria neglecta]|uniref:Uncharacterized protein n=1 Tax=Lepraria neglecta TaxID=209136 RepID=A0AAD9ZGR3_9LECA|nr:hypothetical protein OEA41_000938 [Lepraria neglecta]